MDPHVHRALHMREQLKQIYRARLPHMGWCDDNTRRKQQVEAAYSQVRGDWEAEAGQYQSVAAAALEASSTDNEHQTIDLTLANDRSFWSSSGHPSSVAQEALLYELAGPACRVVSIKLAPYRALYQDGYPVYPPMRLQVWVGASPYTLQPASPWHDVQASDALQTFALWPHAPIGRYLQVRMYGKLQKQREDMQFYVAVRHVDATGTVLSTLELLAVQPLLRSNTLQLPATANPGVPATCSSALQAAADYGLGPEQAVHSAAARHLQEEQQQGGGQGQWSRLVVRRRALRQAQAEQGAGRVAEQQPAPPLQQQQRQQQGSAVQRVTAGLRTILGRRGAEAVAVPGLSEAGPSKRPQQQQQQPQPAPQPPPLPAHHPQQQHCWQGLPLWLADEAAAAPACPIQEQQESAAVQDAAGEHPHQHHPHQHQQQQQQQQGSHGGHAEGLNRSGSEGGSLGSDSEDEQAAGGQQQQQYEQQYRAFRGEGSDGDEEEGEGEEWAEQPAAQLHLGPAELEAAQRLTHQIAVRLQAVPPWQQEQVLAELLADEPLGGRAGRQAYRQHLADLQEQLRQQQQQPQSETVPLVVAATAPPVIAIFSGSNSSSSSSCTDKGVNSSSGEGSSWCEVPGFGSQDCDWVVKARVALDQQFATALGFEIDSMVEAVAGVDEDELRLRQRYAASYHAAAVTHAARQGSAAAGAGGGSAGTETAAAAAAAGGGGGDDGGGGVDRKQQGGEADVSVSDFQGFADMWGSAGSTAQQDPPAAEALPVLTAADMFVWQAPQSAHTSSSSTRAGEQQQWLSLASCFCEGLV